jgi:phage repressor protein C with HTH and peptisase S24 domain
MISNATQPVRITEFRVIPSLIIAHQCGFNPLIYEESMEYLSVPEVLLAGIKNPFYATAAGDSMAPKIEAGDELLIDLNDNAKSGDIVTCRLNGSLLVKQFIQVNFSAYLRSLNKNHPEIKLNENDDFEILGKVIVVIKRI